MPAWLTGVEYWGPVVAGSVASTAVMWLRLKRAQLKAARAKFPPTTAPPPTDTQEPKP